MVFAIDRDTRRVMAVDLAKGEVVASAALAAGPDYVRFMGAVGEVWVTEPRAKRIERFLWRARSFAAAGAIEVPDGPESLAADGTRAYTHSWKGESYAIDLGSGEVVARFQNGCEGARGLALDAAHGLLFAGCAEGKVTSVSLATLQPVGSAPAGKGVDIIAFAPGLRHLYAPAGDAASLTVNAGHAWVCDPAHGRLLVFRDPP